MNHRTFIITTLLCTGLSSLSAQAAIETCPSKFYRNDEGFFISDQPPGWRSYKPSPNGTTLKVDDFGGAVFSPEHKRIACVYRDSNNKWVALVSSRAYAFSQDDLNIDAWKYNHKRKMFVCGTPESSRTECHFKVDTKKIK